MIRAITEIYSDKIINNKSGFTLMEITIIIGVMAVLGLMMVPNATAYIQKADDARIESNIREVHKATELVVQTNPNLSVKDIYRISDENQVSLASEIATYANINSGDMKIVEYALANENSDLNRYYISPSKVPDKVVVRFNTDRGTYWFEKKTEDVANNPIVGVGRPSQPEDDDVNFEPNDGPTSGLTVVANNSEDGRVFVEVEGQSYQAGGSGINIVPPISQWSLSSGVKLENDTLTIPAGERASFTIYTNGKAGRYWYNFKQLGPATYIVNSAYYDKDNKPTKEGGDNHFGNGYAERIDSPKEVFRSNYSNWGENIHKVVISIRPFAEVNQWHEADSRPMIIKDFAITLGQNAYQPPVKSPDNPIEIESLNNFDIVSSKTLKTKAQLAGIPYDTITNDTYKTNISLSEPLRSVDTIKDELFRDTDNLWKIRRNVGFKRLSNPTNTWSSPQQLDTNYVNFYSRNSLMDMDRVHDRNSPIVSNWLETIPQQHYTSLSREALVRWSDVVPFVIVIKRDRVGGSTSSHINEYLKKNPLEVFYELKTPTVQILPRVTQDKLNSIPSFKGENHVYTLVDSPNIIPKITVTFDSKK